MKTDDASNDNGIRGNPDAMRRRSGELRQKAAALQERIAGLQDQYYALLTRADCLDETINEIDPPTRPAG